MEDLQADQPGAITDGPFGSNLTSAHYTEVGARVVRLQNIGDGVFNDTQAYISDSHFKSLQKHEVRVGDLLVASLGEVLPRACLAPEGLGPAIVKADCIRVRLAQTVEARWVLYALQTPFVRKWAADHLHGVGRPRLGLKVIRGLPVPVPPIDEQRRIVDLLEDHFSRLNAAEATLDHAERSLAGLRERVVRDIITGVGVSGSRSNDVPGAEGVEDGSLASLPAGWQWLRLRDLAEVVGGVTKDSGRQSDPAFVEVPYLRVANVQRGRLVLDKITHIRVAQAKAHALRLMPGDVLMNEGGDRDKLGRGWIWEGQVEDCVHQNHVFRARVVGGLLHPKLLSWAANTIGGRWCEKNGKQSVNLASISLNKIRLMPVPVAPTELQEALVQRIDEALTGCDRLQDALSAQRRRLASLRCSLLAAAFGGRLIDAPAVREGLYV